MLIDYKAAISRLMEVLPFIKAVVVVKGKSDIVYSTGDWGIEIDIGELISSWLSMRRQPLLISGVKYLIRDCTSDRFVASSSRGDGHIVGVKDEERTMLAIIEPDGIIPFTTTEMVRTLASLIIKEPYLEEDIQLGQKTELRDYLASATGNKRVSEEKAQQELKKQPELDLPFTARLMAYYRAQENKKDHPLIVDPYAEHLAGDLSLYLNEHVRYSEMDYPIVRSYYIEEQLLTPWCNTQENSQIVLLGAGLDTRAYRFEPLQTNSHTIFEIDFPNIINYKEEILSNEMPLCDLVRLSLDLSKADWTSNLIKSGFSSDILTFWVLEGLVYYIEREEFASFLKKMAELSANNSQIFVDILQQSRWFSSAHPLEGSLNDPFSKHIKWGLDIRAVSSFFAEAGWNVTCSFADEHDQGRNVGQKGMIFIQGELVKILT